jgi:uncharacterized metal-binding protein YceD (DUF177 family)
MTARQDAHRLEATIRVDSLPPEGRALRVEATEAQRQIIAEELGITAVEALQAELSASPFRGGVRVTGRLTARIEQPCVVSLVPVHQDIDEEVDRVYLPEGGEARHAPAEEIYVDLEGDDLPDHFDGREADLSDLLVETLALAIDPYPHAPGARLETEGDVRDREAESPFAALKKLRTDGSDG